MLVSNYISGTTTFTRLSTPGSSPSDALQLFTTGTNAAGYTLTSITFEFYPLSQPSPVPTVKLHNVTVAGGSVTLGTAVATLTTSATTVLYTPEETYTAPTYTAPTDTGLDPSTTYGIFAEGGVNGNAIWGGVPTGSVDGTPAAGWSIGDYMATRAHDSTGNFTVGSDGPGTATANHLGPQRPATIKTGTNITPAPPPTSTPRRARRRSPARRRSGRR